MKSVLLVDDDTFLQKPFVATQLADAIERAFSPGDSWQPQMNSS